ncbi:LOW QUALITY PROTEIN: hypothetical protein CRUP_023441 [Coryphaenoides rupestris]|nr:LOW QUALITY PROTEIN: hypothetical protein CRUP_023441 [Coryphaenoides rupestris]
MDPCLPLPPRPFLPAAGPPALPGSDIMSLRQSLGPVQSWLGQELEKCGIDAVVYTRYENDIFLGWEKGTGKKWGKSKRKGGTDLSLEEKKKQAAVHCLRSASDENSGIESLVEELCSKLKDIQNQQKGIMKPSPLCPRNLFVCKRSWTVWNKAKACAYSSSSSAAPQTSTDNLFSKRFEGEATKERSPEPGANTERAQAASKQGEGKPMPRERIGGGKTCRPLQEVHEATEQRGSIRGRLKLQREPGDSKLFNNKAARTRQKSREAGKAKRGRNSGQLKFTAIDRGERRNAGGGGGGGGGSSVGGAPVKQTQLYRKGKRPLKEIRKDQSWAETKESVLEARNNKEYMEEPLWYTEPITDYFVPFSSKHSKLETKYRSNTESMEGFALSADMERLPEGIRGICITNESYQRTYLAAGSFVDGHFVEGPDGVEDEADDLAVNSCCPQPEDGGDLDDKHLSEFTHFYEVDIYQSILDTSASDIQESRILNMIRQKSKEQRDIDAECCLVLDGLELRGESAIRAESQKALESDGFLMQDPDHVAKIWGSYSPSSSEDVEGESFMDTPIRLSPLLDSVSFSLSMLHPEEPRLPEVPGEPPAPDSSCFSLFELQYDSPTVPSFPCDSFAIGHENNTDSSSCLDPHSNKQSRLLIWTKNSAFDETEQNCSNLSTRTCSPWSHSEETRSDNEQGNVQTEDPAQFGNEEINCIIPPISGTYLEEEILEFLQEDTGRKCEESKISTPSSQTFTKKSKLESICGIALEEDNSAQYNSGIYSNSTNQQSDDYSSGMIKDIWTAIGDGDPLALQQGAEKPSQGLLLDSPSDYSGSCLEVQAKVSPIQGPAEKAVQRSEYHLWEGKNKEQVCLVKNQLPKADSAGDYMTPSKPWDMTSDKESTSFILGGVYGELKMLSGDKNWAVVPPGEAQGSLLQCAAAAASASGSDMVTVSGTDVFMNGKAASGHRPLWRPLVSFGQGDHQAIRGGGGEGLNKGFSFIFHEDLLGSYGGFRSKEQDLEYPFASINLTNPFSQVLHVECSFEPEDMASFSPGFKPKSILCSDSESEALQPRIYGINRTQYRAIRISPRTHFRPISASDLSPAGGSDSEAESEKEEISFPAPPLVDVFEDPQADLKPLEEDAECEGPYYGKSELESGKFLPRLKKSGMEKSAQTSLDSQEGSSTLLPIAEQEVCLDCKKAAASAIAIEQVDVPLGKFDKEAPYQVHGIAYDLLKDKPEFPLLSISGQGGTSTQQDDCWWQNTLCSPLFPGSQCTGSSNF